MTFIAFTLTVIAEMQGLDFFGHLGTTGGLVWLLFMVVAFLGDIRRMWR